MLQPATLTRAAEAKDTACIEATDAAVYAVLRAVATSVPSTPPVLDVVSSVIEKRDGSAPDARSLLKCCEFVAHLLRDRAASAPVRSLFILCTL